MLTKVDVLIGTHRIINNRVGDGCIHMSVPRTFLTKTLIPGVSLGADVELVVFKDMQAVADYVSDMGDTWLLSEVEDLIMSGQVTKVFNILKSLDWVADWSWDDVVLGLPLEYSNLEGYKMPVTSVPNPKYLSAFLSCKKTVLYDSHKGIQSLCVDLCHNCISHFMNHCQLGGSWCTKGLSSANT